MRYRLQTLLIVITALAIGFGGGIAIEKWRAAKEQSRIALEQARIAAIQNNAAPPVTITSGMTFRDVIKARGAASRARQAARAAKASVSNP